MHRNNERGIALITTLIVMMLMSALLVGFTAVVMSDQRYRFIDRDRGQAFYAASGGLEKMTADLGNLFLAQVAPTALSSAALTASGSQPTIANVTFTARCRADIAADQLADALRRAEHRCGRRASTGYTIRFCAAPNGNPTTTSNYADQDRPVRGTGRVADAVSARRLGADVHRR